MATKKTKAVEPKAKKSTKKKDSITLEMPGTIGSAKIILPKEKKKTKSKDVWPKIVQGTHLTVITYENGKTELKWDWDALVSEVRNACLKAESTLLVSTEATAEVKPKRKKSKTK